MTINQGGESAEPTSERKGEIRQLYEREHTPMVRLAHLMLGSQTLAEEVVHDAFVSLLRRSIRPENPGAYLRRAVINACNSTGRRRTMGRIKLQAVQDRERSASITLPPELDETWTVLARLQPRQRAALALRYYEDLPVNEIADLMQTRPGTVKSLIHRGLKALEQELTDDRN